MSFPPQCENRIESKPLNSERSPVIDNQAMKNQVKMLSIREVKARGSRSNLHYGLVTNITKQAFNVRIKKKKSEIFLLSRFKNVARFHNLLVSSSSSFVEILIRRLEKESERNKGRRREKRGKNLKKNKDTDS